MRTLTLLTSLAVSLATLAGTPPTPAMLENLSSAPAGFEENKGQVRTTDGNAAPYVRYRLSDGNTQLFLLESGIAYQFSRLHYPQSSPEVGAKATSAREGTQQMGLMPENVRLETFRMDMELEGADPSARITTEGRSEDYTQYYNHDALDVHTYTKVTYHEIYPGIDWVVYTTEKGMKYDFVVRPGADPNQIHMRFKDHEELSVDADGNLIHGNRMGRFTEERPVSFQDGKEVPTSFVLEGNVLRFALEYYDRSQTLTIDPDRIWGTYYGGTSIDEAFDCAVDGSGNVYLTGYSYSADAIASGGHQNSSAGSSDAFLAKFNSSGTRLWATFYGGPEQEIAFTCSVDGSNNVYLAGDTYSSTGIATTGAYQTALAGNDFNDAFLVKFDATGTRLWATYYGGSGFEDASGCAIDATGNVYVSGRTTSDDGIASGGHQDVLGGATLGLPYDAFLVKFNAAGARLWATYYGGSESDAASGCAVDVNGAVYLAGTTRSPDAIASGGQQNAWSGETDAFLVKFNASGVRQWGTYYGGSDFDNGLSCAVDGAGNVYMAGNARSLSGIGAGGHQNAHAGGTDDAFLAKFNTSGVRLWATYYGGASADSGIDCTTDGNNYVYLTGTTASPSGISFNGFQNTYAGGWDGYLVKFNSTGTRQWGTYYGSGGAFDDQSDACTTDGDNNVYMAGWTGSSTVIASGGHQNTFGGGTWDGFLVKFEGDEPIVLGCATALVSETEPNNTVGAANPLTYGTAISGEMGDCTTTDNTSDYFSFTSTTQGVLTVEFCMSNTGPEDLLVPVRLLNSAGTTLATSHLVAGANDQVHTSPFYFICVGLGSYFIAVDNPSTTVCTHYALSYSMEEPVFGNDPEPNDAIGASATPVAYDTYIEGRINFMGESTYDYFSLLPPTNGVMNIEVQAEHVVFPDEPLQVALLSSTGALLQTWDVVVGDYSSPYTTNLSVPCRSTVNTYYLRINSDECGISYRFKYTVTPPLFANDPEPNNAIGATATPVAYNTDRDGQNNFDAESTYDYYSITLPTNGVLNIETQAEHAGAVPSTMAVVLLNSVGTVQQTWSVAVGANGTPAADAVSITCRSTVNTYYIRINSAACGTSYRFKYTVTAPLFAADVEPNNSQPGTPLAHNTYTEGHLAFDAESTYDYYRIVPSTDGKVNIELQAEHTGATAGTIQLAFLNSGGTALQTWNIPVGTNGVASTTLVSLPCQSGGTNYDLRLSTATCGTSYKMKYTLAPALFAIDAEPNNSTATAVVAADSTDIDGHLAFFGESSADYFRIQAATDGVLNVTVSAEHAIASTTDSIQVRLFDYITNTLVTWKVGIGANGIPNTQSFVRTCAGTEQVYFLAFLNPSVCGVSYRFSYTVTPPAFADDLEPNQSSGQATIANANTNYDGRVEFDYDNNTDYFQLQAPTDGVMSVTIEAENAGSGTGTMTLYLRDYITNIIETWTVNVGANGVPISNTFTHRCTGNEQVYYLQHENPSVCGVSYRFSYSVTPPVFADDLEPNQSSAQAINTTAGVDYNGRVDFNYDNNLDYFRLQATNDGILNVTIEAENAGPGAGTMTLYLRDAVTNVIETWTVNVGANGTSVPQTFSHTCTGTQLVYYLEPYNPTVCGVSYRLSYTLTPPVFANDTEPNNSTATAVVAADSTNYDGRLAFTESSVDYFRLQAGTDGVLNVTVSAEHATASTTDSIQVRLMDYITNTLVTWKVGIGANGIPNTQTLARTCAGTEQVYYLQFLNPSVCGVSYRFSYTVTPPAFADDLEPNQSTTQAIIANANTNYDGRIEFNYDNNTDYFRLQAPTDGVMSLTIEAENAGTGTGTMTLYLRDYITNAIETWTVNVGANGVPITNTFTHRCSGTEQVYYLQHENPSVCGVSYRFSYSVTPPVFGDDLEPNQSTTQAIDATAGVDYDGRVDFNYDNDIDYFRLQAPNDGALTVTIEAENAGPGTGTMTLYLRDFITNAIETWTVNIGANGTSVPQTFSHTCTGLEQVYFLQTDNPTMCGVSYRFSYTVTPPLFADDLEPNQSSAQAVDATAGVDYDGRMDFNYDNDVDYFRLQAPTDGVLNVTIEAENAGPGTGTMTLYLRDFITNAIETWTVNIGANGTTVPQTFSHTCAGTEQVYYLETYNPNVCGVSYRFSYTVTPPVFADDLEPNQSSGAAIVANANTNYDGRIEFNYDNNTDYFRLQAPTDGVMSVTIQAEHAGTATGGTMTVYLRDFITNAIETWTVNVGANGVPISNTFSHLCAGTEQVYYLQPDNPSVCGVSYRFSYAVAAPVFADDLEPNQSSGQAINIDVNAAPADGRVEFQYDNNFDYFRINHAGGPIVLKTQAETAGVAGTMQVLIRDAITNVLQTAVVPVGGGSVPVANTYTSPSYPAGVYFIEPFNPTSCGTSYRFECYDDDNDGTCNAFDLCAGGAEPGTPCDDLNSGTENDVIGANCVCAGTPIAAVDCNGILGGPAQPGTPCDDLDACTVNDVYTGAFPNCGCAGTFADADADGTCDANDLCPGGPEPGTACDDNSACTTNDVIQTDCSCAGVAVDPNDNNACTIDSCDPILGVINAPIDPDDGDPCTLDSCDPINGVSNVFQDADNDGTCDANDLCPGGPEPGTACNDGDDDTENDVIGANCQCAGTPIGGIDCNGVAGGPAQPGTPCDDLNACTVNDVYTGAFPNCGCAGTFADADNDGTCDANDLCPGGPEPGTPCDDGSACTTNDLIQSDCSCEGTAVDPNDNNACTIDTCDPILGVINTPINPDDGNPCTLDSCDPLTGVSNVFQDADGDGTCDANDGCPSDPNKIAVGNCGCGNPEPGATCDDGDANTNNDLIQVNCTCAGTPIGGCTVTATLDFQTDGISTTTWEVRAQGTNALVLSGGGVYPGPGDLSEDLCLAEGCYYLVVMDDNNDGITGGGYILSTIGGDRLIDNRNNFTTGSSSQIANNEGFCLPIGHDRMIYTSCEKLDWNVGSCDGSAPSAYTSEFIVADINQTVTAAYGVSNANTGFQFWFFDPNGGYSFRRLRNHAQGENAPMPANNRYTHCLLNNWAAANHLQQNTLYNVRVRPVISGNFGEFGRACRMKLDQVAAQCPVSKLMDVPFNPFLSCGEERQWGSGNYVHARPVWRYNNNCVKVNANRYQFRFQLVAEFYDVTVTSGNYGRQLNWGPAAGAPLQAGKTYEVTVRASFDNGASYCPVGDVCLLTIALPAGLQYGGTQNMVLDSSTGLRMYPNPNRGDQLYLALDQVEEGVNTVSVDIYDLFGKRVCARTLAVNDGFISTVLELKGELAAGMYLVNITAGETVHTERLVIQP